MPTLFSDPGIELQLDTKLRHHIENFQAREISPNEVSEFADIERQFGVHAIDRKSSPTPTYNCHGMTFASRRTRVYDAGALDLILRDDGYIEVAVNNVCPGDVILYLLPNGEIWHSGIVIRPPGENPLGMPLVISKWGNYCEFVHYANVCPYMAKAPTLSYRRMRP